MIMHSFALVEKRCVKTWSMLMVLFGDLWARLCTSGQLEHGRWVEIFKQTGHCCGSGCHKRGPLRLGQFPIGEYYQTMMHKKKWSVAEAFVSRHWNKPVPNPPNEWDRAVCGDENKERSGAIGPRFRIKLDPWLGFACEEQNCRFGFHFWHCAAFETLVCDYDRVQRWEHRDGFFFNLSHGGHRRMPFVSLYRLSTTHSNAAHGKPTNNDHLRQRSIPNIFHQMA